MSGSTSDGNDREAFDSSSPYRSIHLRSALAASAPALLRILPPKGSASAADGPMARKMLKDGEVAVADGANGGEESYDYDLFVIGAGSGGIRGSRNSAGFGAKVAICELPFHPISSDWLGGHGVMCVICGCVPKKILVYGASFRGEFEDAKQFGWEINGDINYNWKKYAICIGGEIVSPYGTASRWKDLEMYDDGDLGTGLRRR